MAKPDLTIQNATANACAFACVAGGALPGCKGFNYYSNVGLRDTVINDNGQEINLKLPILPDTCELYSKSSIDASPMVPDVSGANGNVIFYQSLQ